MILVAQNLTNSIAQIVLFPFDDYAIPLQRGVELSLQGHQGRGKLVLEPGTPNSPDGEHVAYYGNVKRVGNEFWMWHLGQAAIEDNDQNPWFQRVCFAKSKDGFSWEKPILGLVEFNGSKENNLVTWELGLGMSVLALSFTSQATPIQVVALRWLLQIVDIATNSPSLSVQIVYIGVSVPTIQ